jgi:nucleotide sugar dehydrogenase
MDTTPLIGFIGQGWIGKNYADDFESRGYEVVRYALEPQYVGNKDRISACDIVLIAVPTPTTVNGFDDSIVRGAVGLVGKGKIAVIKSTMQPGSTESIQQQYPDALVMHSPEFLRESNAAYDAAHPTRNIVGIPVRDERYENAARHVLAVLPEAPYTQVCTAREAEYIKYAGNAFLFLKVLFANIMFDVANAEGADWNAIMQALSADPRIGPSHLRIMHESRPGVVAGRGAGGHCFIKDFAAMRELYERIFPNDTAGSRFFRSLECKNAKLLMESGKDIDLLEGVYGDTLKDLCTS